MRIKGIYLVVIILAVCLLITGCGKSPSEKISDKIAEKVTEKALEKAVGDKAKVDINKDGGIEIKAEEGTVKVGGNYEWPATMPSDVPKLTEGQIVSIVESDPSKGQPKTVSVSINNVSAGAITDYQDKIKANGWTIVHSVNDEKQMLLLGHKEKKNVSVIFTKSDGDKYAGGVTYAEE